tara:strand:- start:3287 stop:3985 length:699 start_codon:yes stop_codon:yes gene_type:complete
MKLLITTRADDGIKSMTDYTHPLIKKYADKVGADFLVMSHLSDCGHNQGKWHYRILKHYDLFEDYDRILHLDSDMVITDDCPNLFEEVPYDSIASVYEDKGTRTDDRRQRIRNVQNLFGDVNWSTGYINTGVFLASKVHKDIFQKINDKYYESNGYDDVHLGYQIHKHNFDVYELSYKWNHMTMFSESWNNFANRFDSFIIHYAGVGIFDGGCVDRIDQIKKDLEYLNKDRV